MVRRLGYACLCQSLPAASPRGTLLRNATPARLRQLIAANLDGLAAVLRFNVQHRIRLFRISSDVIPFGSHPVNGVPWWHEQAGRLAEIGAFIRAHDLRVSVHPGQYTVLSSPRPEVVEAAVRDLEYHARLLDSLGVDGHHKIVLHLGGAYGDKAAALRRWIEAVHRLPDAVRARLIVENDERLFGADDVLRASDATGAPVVFDALHHRVYEGRTAARSGVDARQTDILRAVFATWDPIRDGPPKMHYSTQAVGLRPGAHAEHVDPAELTAFLAQTPPDAVFDVMLEAKAKEQALFRIREAISALVDR
jgi:UV DNA damage endonuclease